MQYVNDDMDELFRRAAENYPLDTSSKDWNKVLQALQNNGEEKAVNKGSGKGRFLWLLLLLPMAFLCNRYMGHSDLADQSNLAEKTTGPGAADKATGLPTKPQTKETESQPPTDASSVPDRIAVDDKKTEPQPNTGLSSNLSVLSTSKTPWRYKTNRTRAAKSNYRSNGIELAGGTDLTDANNFSLLSGYISGGIKNIHPSIEETSPSARNIVDASALKSAKNKNKRFYAGVLGGIDATTIKFQKVEDAGYDYGLLLGYKLGKNWSIESGVFFDKKFYYSEGKYFNSSKLWAPPNWELMKVSGNCKMIEVPVSVRYQFASASRHTWFATAGVSSYFMKEEDYSYLYKYPSGTAGWHSSTYKSGSKNLFSVAQFSAGYTHAIGKIGDLRIEPYIKLPVSGIGIGKMPFLSAGMHVGLTRPLF